MNSQVPVPEAGLGLAPSEVAWELGQTGWPLACTEHLLCVGPGPGLPVTFTCRALIPALTGL